MMRLIPEFTAHQRLVLLFVVPAAVVLAAWHMVLNPARAGNIELRHRIENAVVNLRRGRAAARTLTLRALQVSAFERMAHHYEARLDHGGPPELLLATLTDIARLESVEIVEFKPRRAIDRGSHLETPVDVTLEGAYHDIARTLDAVGTPPALALLSDIHVTARTRAGGRGSVRASFVASTRSDTSSHSAAPLVEMDAFDNDAPAVDVRYDDGGRRDPFGSLIAPARMEGRGPATRHAGLAGVSADDVVVKGVVRHGTEMLAILETTTRQSFVVRPKDRLSDSSVLRIEVDGVVLARAATDGAITHIKKPLFRAVREHR